MILRTLLRWVWVAVAFLIAAAIAVTVLFVLGIFWMGDEIRGASRGDEFIWYAADFLAAVFFTSAVAPALTALPGLLAVVAGEIFRIRSWIFYTLAGGAALAVIPLLAGEGAQAAAVPSADYMTLFAAAGFAGGISYWTLAGARA